jgi:enterochelin esterase family protein
MITRIFVALLVVAGTLAHAQDMPLSQVLIENEKWQLVSSGHEFTDGLTADERGNLYFADVKGGTTINKISADGKTSVYASDAPRISGMQFSPDGRLIACQGGTFGRIVAFTDEDEMQVIADGVKPNDLVVTHDGGIYFTETSLKQVTYIPPGGEAVAADVGSDSDGVQKPNGIALSPDQGTLAVSDHGGQNVWVWRIESNGKLTHREPYMTMRLPSPDAPSKGDGMTTDADGRYYVTSAVGIQVFDPTGRMGGVIAAPTDKPIVSVAFAGPDLSYLYVAAGDEIYRRKTKTHGVLYFKSP